MDVTTFLRRTKAPVALAPHLLFLNPGDDFTPYLTEPNRTDWHTLSPAERILHSTRLLHNGWRYWSKREITFDVDRDSILESVFTTLCRAAGKLHSGIENPGGYLFTAVRNAISKEIEKQRQRIGYRNNFNNLEFDKTGYRHGRKTIQTAIDWQLVSELFAPDSWGSVLESYELLDSLCNNETERAILYERWRKPSEGWLSPEWASVIADRLELPLAYVLNTLDSLQARYVAAVNELKRQQHQRQIRPVPLSHISPDEPALAQSDASTAAA